MNFSAMGRSVVPCFALSIQYRGYRLQTGIASEEAVFPCRKPLPAYGQYTGRTGQAHLNGRIIVRYSEPFLFSEVVPCPLFRFPKPSLTLLTPRVERTRLHSLHDILVIALCAVLCGAESWDDCVEFAHAKREWLASRLRLENGIPCADTFRRVFARLDPEAFTAGFLRWTQAVREESKASSLPVIAVDGKTLRHSFDTASGQKAVPIVSAWASESRLVLAQTQVSEKSNEITAVPALLSLLDIAGCIVTAVLSQQCPKGGKNPSQDYSEALGH